LRKIIVTFFETKKWDLDHYGLSDEVDVFFQLWRPVFKNGHL